MDGAVDAGAHTHLAHVAQALRQTWRQAHHVVLETTTTTTTRAGVRVRTFHKFSWILSIQKNLQVERNK